MYITKVFSLLIYLINHIAAAHIKEVKKINCPKSCCEAAASASILCISNLWIGEPSFANSTHLPL